MDILIEVLYFALISWNQFPNDNEPLDLFYIVQWLPILNSNQQHQ